LLELSNLKTKIQNTKKSYALIEMRVNGRIIRTSLDQVTTLLTSERLCLLQYKRSPKNSYNHNKDPKNGTNEIKNQDYAKYRKATAPKYLKSL